MVRNDAYVDLRVLLVMPLLSGEDLLHVALEDFRFSKLAEAHDVESASDQLMFNKFDLVIARDLSRAQYADLLTTVRSGLMGNPQDLPVQIFCDQGECPEMPGVYVSPPVLDLHQTIRVLKNAFAQARKFMGRVRLAHSRLRAQASRLSAH